MNEPDERGSSYEYDLWVQLGTCIDMYRNDRDAYWTSRLDREDWSRIKQLRQDADDIAAAIRRRAFALRNVVDLSDLNAIYEAYRHAEDEALARWRTKWSDLEVFLRNVLPEHEAEELLRQMKKPDPEAEGDSPLRLIWERLCIDDAFDVVDTICDRVRRTLELDRLIDDVLGQSEPPGACVRFLALISRCYIYGFTAECVVMCRGAIDVAFREKVTDEHCKRSERMRRQRSGRKPSSPSLADRISAAFDPKNNLLASRPDSPALFKAAQNVKYRGDKAVHYDPDATKDVAGTVEQSLRVIRALADLPDPA